MKLGPLFIGAKNEDELFEYQSKRLKEIEVNQCLVVIFNDNFLTNQLIDLYDLMPRKI